MTKNIVDLNMYFKVKDGKQIVILLHVDDLLITKDNDKEVKNI
jgi:hypothetical protein